MLIIQLSYYKDKLLYLLNKMAGLQALPIDIHIMIAKFLNLRDCLIYSQVSRVTFDAVYFVFSHRKQLDFGSVLGPDKAIILPDSVLLKVMHAHTRAEIITDFCVSRSFAELEWYMERYWHVIERSDFSNVGHEMGQLTNIIYPKGSHYGALSRKQGCKLNILWEEYSDDYGVFGVSSDSPYYRPLNNAPSNWSSIDLDTPCTWDSQNRPWTSERVWRSVTSNKLFKKHHRLPTSDEIVDMN